MALSVRSSKKTKTAEEKADAKQQKQNTGGATEAEDDAPMPYGSRIVIIILTSFIAEKIWRYRTFVSAGWYSDNQSPIEQAMITAFEYTIVMGMLFFTGIIVSVATVSIQKKLTG